MNGHDWNGTDGGWELVTQLPNGEWEHTAFCDELETACALGQELTKRPVEPRLDYRVFPRGK